MKSKLIMVSILLFLLVAGSGFTLAPSRYTITIAPGDSVDIPYNLKSDVPGDFAVTAKTDNTYTPLPEEWLSLPKTTDGDFKARLSIPKSADPDNYSVWISVATTEGTIRAELCSRLLVTVAGEPVTPTQWILMAIAVAVTVILFGIIYFIRRRRYA